MVEETSSIKNVTNPSLCKGKTYLVLYKIVILSEAISNNVIICLGVVALNSNEIYYSKYKKTKNQMKIVST